MPADLIAKYGLSRSGHALFAPSSASGWLNCPGYVLANAEADDTAGIDAAYGTVAHEMAQRMLQGEDTARFAKLIRKIKAGGNTHLITIDKEMLGYVSEYTQWCQELEGDHFVEQSLDLSHLMPIPDQRGTADHFACQWGTLVITDLKMGTGVRVFARQNPQAMLYALGAFEEWDWVYGFQDIVIRICQPRLEHFDVWYTNRRELLEFAEFVRIRAEAAWQEDAPRIATPEGCKWCRVRTTCPAVSAKLAELADTTFEDLEVTSEPKIASPKELATTELVTRLRYRGMFEKWFREMADELERRAFHKGEIIPGMKIVRGRKSRDWLDPDRAATELIHLGVPGAAVVTMEVTSVAQAEKELRKVGLTGKEVKNFSSYRVKETPGKLTLVDENDQRRPASEEADVFDDVSDDDDDL